MYRLALVAAGGAAGSVARYLVSGWMRDLFGHQFPYGTLTVNLVGCLVIGWLMGLSLGGRSSMPEDLRLMLVIGVLGGFTTFSSFGWETIQFVNDSQWLRASMNILLNNVLGLGLALAGYRLGELWPVR
jgi:CrcB protein